MSIGIKKYISKKIASKSIPSFPQNVLSARNAEMI